MSARKGENTTSEFYCTACGQRGIPIMRKPSQQRKGGHLKKLWCLNCGTVNHVEIRPYGSYRYEDFLLEFYGGNFENGKRKLPYQQFITALDKNDELYTLQDYVESKTELRKII